MRQGSKVITTPITFAASANCVRYCGGDVVFSDIDPNTYLLDIGKVKSLLLASPKGTYAGIIPVDFAGQAVNMEELKILAEEHGLWILEDACHAPGGYFVNSKGDKEYCGNGNYADLAIFSFHPVKHIACGEGGMITTNDENLYKAVLQLRTHGIVKSEELYINSTQFANGFSSSPKTSAYPGWYMEMQELGYNYRLTDFQAALGLSQLKRAKDGLNKRRGIAQYYYESFRKKKFIKGQSGVVEGHAYHLYIVETEDRLGLYNYLKKRQILTQIHYIPCHLMPYYRQFGWKEGDLPHAENYYRSCMSLPMYPTLTNEEQKYVIDSISEYFGK